MYKRQTSDTVSLLLLLLLLLPSEDEGDRVRMENCSSYVEDAADETLWPSSRRKRLVKHVKVVVAVVVVVVILN